ncbi:hypothetical protein [Rhizobium sp. Leaf386]|uniref:hypothetical protein n=1 Tax=Rhizobium sp. Leaf386 TaxID=1736359 RepID=UPI000A5EA30A|nr:hypothetical protein [Rhizobium sp. Leaf386]
MNTDAALAIAIVALLVVFFYGPWQEVCIAWARQVAFEKRDAVFDLARKGELNFNSAEYRTIRQSMEMSIRFAHELTLPKFLILRLHRKLTGFPPVKSRLQVAIERIPDKKTRHEVYKLAAQMHFSMMAMMAARSPLTVCLWLVYIVMKSMHRHPPMKIIRYARPMGEVIQLEAEADPVNRLMPGFKLAA